MPPISHPTELYGCQNRVNCRASNHHKQARHLERFARHMQSDDQYEYRDDRLESSFRSSHQGQSRCSKTHSASWATPSCIAQPEQTIPYLSFVLSLKKRRKPDPTFNPQASWCADHPNARLDSCGIGALSARKLCSRQCGSPTLSTLFQLRATYAPSYYEEPRP